MCLGGYVSGEDFPDKLPSDPADGVLSGKNVFFIKDVLIDTYRKVTALNKGEPVSK